MMGGKFVKGLTFITYNVRSPLSAAENFQRIVNGIDFTNKNFDREDGINDESRKIPDKTWQYLRDQIRYF